MIKLAGELSRLFDSFFFRSHEFTSYQPDPTQSDGLNIYYQQYINA